MFKSGQMDLEFDIKLGAKKGSGTAKGSDKDMPTSPLRGGEKQQNDWYLWYQNREDCRYVNFSSTNMAEPMDKKRKRRKSKQTET
jgi:hypothetical protein